MSKMNKHKMMTIGGVKCPIDSEYSGPLEKHHIRGREIRHSEDSSNIAYVSPNTHTLIHEGEIILEGWFLTSDGRELLWHRRGDESITGNDAVPYLIKRG